MARPKRTAKVVALAAAIVPFLSAGLAGAAVTSPGAAEVWRTGETKTIVWGALTDGTAGTFALSLYDASGQIDAAAGRVSDQQTDRPIRPGLLSYDLSLK